MGSKSYEARAKKFDTKAPGATPFQDKLKEYELKAPTAGIFGEWILEIAAWKRADAQSHPTHLDSFLRLPPSKPASRSATLVGRPLARAVWSPESGTHTWGLVS